MLMEEYQYNDSGLTIDDITYIRTTAKLQNENRMEKNIVRCKFWANV